MNTTYTTPDTHKNNEFYSPDLITGLSKALSGPPSKLSAQDRATYLAMLNGAHPDEAAAGHESEGDNHRPRLTTEQANSLIDTLWRIMTTFVEVGFSLSPAQVAQSCGQSAKAGAPRQRDGLKCSGINNNNDATRCAG